MTTIRHTGILLLTALTVMIAGAAVAVPSGLTLNPADPAAVLAAVQSRPGLHLLALALDVLGWTALLAAALTMPYRLAGGLLAAAALAGLLHDAGNLAVTQLAAAPATAMVAGAVLLTAKWTVNLAGLLWVVATVVTVHSVPMSPSLRRTGWLAATSGLAAVAVPWMTGTAGPSPALEQLGYALHLPIMLWYAALAWRFIHDVTQEAGERRSCERTTSRVVEE